ncbi:ATP-binding cassette domain-containing protein [Agromyces soli]|uniref:ABC transporter ATP-binding protein n=1 Tax=Agromyces soli TaxID=659012 RepID=A0ABY4AQG3_9MICO|nr:ABC transporter ATP-binding protein [Agromyces soli]UOE25412.1 ABC transporter ATP-binding protein [Agromyces soli]
MSGAALTVRGLHIGFGGTEVVRGVDLDLAPGRIVALVGESGSGKSVTARALLGLAGRGALVDAERFELDGEDVRGAGERRWRRLRGAKVGLVLQDALASLDPLRPIGREIGDALRLHLGLRPAAARQRVLELLERLELPHPALTIDRRSGELSGGMRQRALIAAAVALDPPVLVADEPTTALDVGVQATVLQLLREAADRGAAVLLISHDLAVVSGIADEILVLADGTVVERGPTAAVLGAPRHAATRALLAAVPTEVPRGVPLLAAARLADPGARVAGSTPPAQAAMSPTGTAPILEAHGLGRAYRSRGGDVTAVEDVSVALRPGRTLGLVGESGSGKTTLARLLLALERPDAGVVRFDGAPWSELTEAARRPARRRIGAIWQDPYGSFDPRWGVARLLRDALTAGGQPGDDRAVRELLDLVRLPAALAAGHPLELSGGQRQRVAIARALAARPEVLIADEPVSALDVTVQAAVLDLLDELQRERGLAMLFISHDLGVVRHMSDELAVMRHGRILEQGEAEQLFAAPQHAYTAALIRHSPRLAWGGDAHGTPSTR